MRRLSVASLDSGAESPVYGEEPSASADRDRRGKPPWVGGGGPMRVVPLSAFRFDETPSSGNGARNDIAGTTASGFSVMLGEAFSMRSGHVHFSDSPSAAAQRVKQLAAFIPEDVRDKDPQFGWNDSRTSVTQSTEVAGIEVRSADTAAVTLPTSVHGQPMELGVPRYATDGQPVVSGRPAWLPAPPVAVLPSAQQVSSGQTAKGALASQLPGFCQAFAGGQAALGRYLAPEASIGGLGGATRDTAMTMDLTVPGQVGAGALTLVTTYDMSVIDQQSGRWYVRDIRASTQPMGTQ